MLARLRAYGVGREREREIYARRPCIVFQRGIPWCKDYTERHLAYGVMLLFPDVP